MKLITQLIFYCYRLLILKWAWQKIFYPPKLDSKYQPTLILLDKVTCCWHYYGTHQTTKLLWDPFSFLFFFLPQNFGIFFFKSRNRFQTRIIVVFFVYLLQIKKKEKIILYGSTWNSVEVWTLKSVSIWSSIYSSISLDDRDFGHH